jgi:hypothetical protein
VNLWCGKTDAEWREIWRLERLREDDMLVYHDEVGGQITGKALAEKFNLRVGRVRHLIRRRREDRERERLSAELEQFKTDSFTSIAERLWMDLGWLATELEKQAATAASASTPPSTARS